MCACGVGKFPQEFEVAIGVSLFLDSPSNETPNEFAQIRAWLSWLLHLELPSFETYPVPAGPPTAAFSTMLAFGTAC